LIHKKNSFDYLIVILIVLLSFGSLGGAFAPVRVFALVFSPLILWSILMRPFYKKHIYIYSFISIWFAYTIISLLWTPDIEEGFKHVLYNYVHFSTIFFLVYLADKANKPRNAVALGWMLSAICTFPIAFYEVIFNRHLPMSNIESETMLNVEGDLLPFRYADTTFGDLNSFSIFLSYSLLFTLFGVLINRKNIYSRAYFICAGVTFCLVLFNSSRGAILSCFIALFVFIYYYFNNRKKYNILKVIIVTLVCIISACFATNEYIQSFGIRFFYRIESGELFQDKTRLEIYETSWRAAKEMLCLGYGAGSEQSVLERIGSPIANSHNLFIEILLQYGIFILVGFSMLITLISKRLVFGSDASNKYLAVSFLLIAAPVFIVVSGYVLSPSFWVFISSLYVISASKINYES
jgi:hypothetical protein